MRIHLSFMIVLLGFAPAVFAQKPAAAPSKAARDLILKKQIFADDVESGLGTVQYAAVRVSIRYKLAAWLWKNGRDDTNRAEALAVKAVEELYEKENEIENRDGLKSDLFTLLEKNAKETAARLKARYFRTAEDDLNNAYEWLDDKGGDKIAADKVLKYLSGRGPYDSSIYYIVHRLREMGSPQFPILLAAILDAEESGRVTMDDASFQLLSVVFSDSAVPVETQRQYFNILLNRARAAIGTQGQTTLGYSGLLRGAIRDFGAKMPDLVAEAQGLANLLGVRNARSGDRRNEAEERINESADKLGALIDEAEKAGDPQQKAGFYVRAIALATTTGKFAKAISAIKALRDVIKEHDMKDRWTDQQLSLLSIRALQRDDPGSSRTAIEMINDEIERAKALERAAFLFFEKKNAIDADDSLNKAMKLLEETSRENPERVYELIQLVPIVKKINKIRLQEAIVLAARGINDLPTPGVDDKAGTEGFRKYVTTVMTANHYLNSVMGPLLKDDKTAAADLAGRIQKREVRVLADMLVGIDALETAQKAAEKTPVEKARTKAL